MRLLMVTQGKWGQRIADHILATAPAAWQIATWRGPKALPAIIDNPAEFLPQTLDSADLLLVLTESPGLTDLAPDLAALAGAKAAIVPVDKRAWAPPGLVRQAKARLEAIGVASAFPMPFCSLIPSPRQHELIREFAAHYGRAEVTCGVEEGVVGNCEVIRETPCGNTRYIVEHLPGVAIDKAAEQAGLLHHYYPCWGGMDGDPVRGEHTLLHVAATMAQKSVAQAMEAACEAGKRSGQDE